MSAQPGDGADAPAREFEVIITPGRRALWRRRLRAAGRGSAAAGRAAGRAAAHGGVVSLRRARRYLVSPEGRRVVARSAVTAVAVGGALVLMRRWLGPARIAAAALSRVYAKVRDAAATVGRAVNAGRWLFPLRGIWRVLRSAGLAATLQLYRPCPDCRARVHHDAQVCWRCGCRHLDRPTRRALWAPRLLGRILTFTLFRPCPDCHRALHADAQVCWRCGWRRSI